ncbi:MAG TPA: peptidylprolyl isomerase [Chromatiales bacterium]|nr:peptidylprolyl isomerase [Thiotrichales bacterium]HIP68336.1 peptidylprolyl isomerase [Chromatiales bacterium]
MFLERIREKSKGLVGALIVGLIAITFALFGIDQYLGGGSAPPVAKVNGAKISVQAFQQALQQRQQQLRDMLGGNIPAGMLEPATLREPVLQGMIRNELLNQTTSDLGFEISDQQLADAIQEIPAFQENGKFSAEKYERLLSQQRRSKAAFEAQLRNGLRLEQLGESFQKTAFLPKASLLDFANLRDQKRKLRYLLLEKSSFNDVVVEDSEIKAYYDNNTAQYMTPEQVKLEYLVLDEKILADQVAVNEEALRRFYEDEIDRFRSPESRKARHILLKMAEGASDVQIKEVEDKARALYERIKAGEDFIDLAKQYSEDDLSKTKGGDLGEILPGDMSPELDKVIFSLQPGKVSMPVKTTQGLHIVRVDEVTGGEQKTFEQARAEIEKEYRQREAETQLVEKSEQLLTLTYEEPGTLAPAADALGIATRTTDWITHTGGADDLAKNPEVLKAAFSDDVLNQGRNSDVIALADGRQIVLRIAEHKPAEPQPLEQVSEKIRQQLSDEKKRKLASEKATEIVNALQQGGSLDELAQQAGAEIKQPEAITRQSRDLPAAIVREAFRMAKPTSGKSSYSALELQAGDFAVISLDAVQDAEKTPTAADLEAAASVLADAYGQRELDAVFKAMEARADIKIYRENLEQK